jgi:hypothetical protein
MRPRFRALKCLHHGRECDAQVLTCKGGEVLVASQLDSAGPVGCWLRLSQVKPTRDLARRTRGSALLARWCVWLIGCHGVLVSTEVLRAGVLSVMDWNRDPEPAQLLDIGTKSGMGLRSRFWSFRCLYCDRGCGAQVLTWEGGHVACWLSLAQRGRARPGRGPANMTAALEKRVLPCGPTARMAHPGG